jgi:cellulose synthase (UDP-forming)
MMVLPLWHRCSYDLRAVLPVTLTRNWAHALAFWDYLRGRPMQWQASGSAVKPVRRFWWGVRLWDGGAAVLWLGLVAWRISAMGAARFPVVVIGGLVYAATVMRVIFPGKKAS